MTIAFEGEGKGGVPLDETNFLWTSVVHVAQKEGKCIPPNARFALSITNEIPLGTSPRAAFLETPMFLLTCDVGCCQEGDWEAAEQLL